MKVQRIFLIAFILFLIQNPFTLHANTTWGPGRTWEIAFLHSGQSQDRAGNIIEFTKQPSTDFTLIHLNQTGYNYSYVGWGDISFIGDVDIKEITERTVSYEYPKGDFPIVLPLVFKDQANWINKFYNYIVNGTINSEVSVFAETTATITNEYFKLELEKIIHTRGEIDRYSLNFPHLFDVSNMYNASITFELTYNLQTGIVNYFEIEFRNLDTPSIYSHQILEFIVVVPDDQNYLDFPYSSILFVTVLIFVRKMKKNSYLT
ncbi:MAG: hypothetical protein OEY49_07910 [Candidatus Heimdallarchaeota archaeon]|nr:hypothetical protein [Candidatus Heimdallarchaeota archaeon]